MGPVTKALYTQLFMPWGENCMDLAERKPVGTKNKCGRINSKPGKPISLRYLVCILIAVVAARILLSFLPCYKIDMGGYKYWSSYLAEKGFGNFGDFYRDVHCVYGPVYMYFLYVTGKIVNLFSLQGLGHEFFVKIWAVLSDIIGAWLIYSIGKKYNKEKLGLALGVLYALNPAVFFNSSVWGQFDSFTATMLLAVVYLFNLKKTSAAVFMYALAALTKPQSIMLLPLVAVLYFKDFPWKKFSLYFKGKDKSLLKPACIESLKKLGLAVAGCMLIYAVIVIPFYKETHFYALKEISVYDSSMTGNLAANKQTKTSGVEESESSKYADYKAVDGREDTYWASAHSDSQWLSVDLGGLHEISKVDLSWNWEYAKAYDIKVSDDAKSWKTVYSESKGNGRDDTAVFSPVKARYVKLECTGRPFPVGLIKIDENSGAIKKAAYRFIDFYSWLLHQYTSSLNDYPYATANAFNLWMVLDKQTVSDKEVIAFGLSSGAWGYIFLAIISVFAMTLLIVRKKSVLALYYAGYFLTMGFFVFGTKMHERYMLPAITFAMLCILWDRRMIIPAVLLSLCSLGNQWHVYNAGNTDSNSPWIRPDDQLGMLIAWVTVLVAVASFIYILWLTAQNKNAKKPIRGKAGKA